MYLNSNIVIVAVRERFVFYKLNKNCMYNVMCLHTVCYNPNEHMQIVNENHDSYKLECLFLLFNN